MTTRITKLIGLNFVPLVVALALLSTNRPALAQPQPPPAAPSIIAAAPAAQDVSIALCAGEDTVTMPDGTEIDFWGFGYIDTANNCVPQLPGPILDGIVPGNTVEISLRNDLDVPTSMIFPGQTSIRTSATSPGVFIDEVPAGGSATYTFVAGPEGTYLYESGRAEEPQVAMGLYGALVVGPPAPIEQILVLGEIDPNLNANPANFDMLNYNPTYWLLNGRAYGGPEGSNPFPDVLDPSDLTTPPATSQPYSSLIEVNAGETVRVRYVNAGAIHHTMSSLNLRQIIVAKDADADPNATDGVSEIIPSGQTTDVDITIPVTAVAGDRFPLFNRHLYLTNGEPGPAHLTADGGGGMMTFIEVAGGAANTPPVAIDDGGAGYTVAQGGTLNLASPGVLGNDTDGDGPDPLTAVLVSGPVNASSFALNPDGSFTYLHNGSATTSDSFTYQANDGLAASNVATVNIAITPATNKHIGDLDRSASNPPGPFWNATVTIRVDNATHGPVSGAVVTGTWSAGVSLGFCVTNSSGTCSITAAFINQNTTPSVTFTVSNVTGAGASGPYVSGNNHDPDTGAQASSGTSITVPLP